MEVSLIGVFSKQNHAQCNLSGPEAVRSSFSIRNACFREQGRKSSEHIVYLFIQVKFKYGKKWLTKKLIFFSSTKGRNGKANTPG